MTVIRRLRSLTAWLLVVVLCLTAAPLHADETPQTQFEVTPKRCVTLRQGQPCFVKLRFEWESMEAMQLCVYGVENKRLKCWTTATAGSIVMPQTLPGTTDYVLVDSAGVELNRATVSVSWVYRKKRSKRRWRLF